MGIPDLFEAAKRRDGITDDDIGLTLGRKGSMVQRYRTGKIPLPVELYPKAAAWIGCSVDELRAAAAVEREDDARALLAVAEAMGAAGKQTEKNLRLAMQLVKQLSAPAPGRSQKRRSPPADSQRSQPAR
jgi:hypothetical protein